MLAFKKGKTEMIIIMIAIGGLFLLGYLFLQILLPIIILGIKGIVTLVRKGHNSKEKKKMISTLKSQTSEEEREKLKDEIRREMLKEELKAEVLAENKAKTSRKSKGKK